jgi:hypothetical protein
LLVGPVEGALDGGGRVTPPAVPAGVGVEPPGDVDRFKFAGGQACVQVAEALQEVLVPEVGGPLVVPLGVRQEQVRDPGGEDLVRLRQVRRVGRHQLVEGVEDGLWRVPRALGLPGVRRTVGVAAEADLLVVVLDVPSAEGGAEPRLRLTHE